MGRTYAGMGRIYAGMDRIYVGLVGDILELELIEVTKGEQNRQREPAEAPKDATESAA